METINKTITEINSQNLLKASESIKEMVEKKSLVIEGNIDFGLMPIFDSVNQKRKFRNYLSRVLKRPTMRSVNCFLHLYSKITGKPRVKIDYSEREKKIQKLRKEWKVLFQKSEEARMEYKKEKGDFYKNIS